MIRATVRVLLIAAVSGLTLAAPASAATNYVASPPRTEAFIPGKVFSFSHEANQMAWYASYLKGCPKRVTVRNLTTGKTVRVGGCPAETSTRAPDEMVEVNSFGRVIFTRVNLENDVDSLLFTASPTTPARTLVQKNSYSAGDGSGEHVFNLAGDGPLLVWLRQVLEFENPGNCQEGYQRPDCPLLIREGAPWRLSASNNPRQIPGAKDARRLIDASDGRVAYVEDRRIFVRDATTGALVSRSDLPKGSVSSLALSKTMSVAIVHTGTRRYMQAFSVRTGKLVKTVSLATNATAPVSTDGKYFIFRRRFSVRLIHIRSGDFQLLARATSRPVGLSLEGNRISWSERVRKGSRIRSLEVM